MVQMLVAVLRVQAGYFIRLAGEGAFAGTVCHRVISLGIIQGLSDVEGSSQGGVARAGRARRPAGGAQLGEGPAARSRRCFSLKSRRTAAQIRASKEDWRNGD
jgi:hypothetical protein